MRSDSASVPWKAYPLASVSRIVRVEIFDLSRTHQFLQDPAEGVVHRPVPNGCCEFSRGLAAVDPQ